MSDNSRVARNATMLTLRTALSTLVGLYTSRVVLSTLGVEDFGIYGVAGSIVGVMGFLNTSMAGATSRFLTFEIGRDNKTLLSRIFSSALIVHLIIALIVGIMAETIGVWFLNNKLNIPAERMYAAHWVFQFSVISAMVGITQVPYSASIFAHERMHIYAYIELLQVILKLLIVYLLVLGNFDKLILYSLLTLIVNLLIAFIYRCYCKRCFSECRFHFIWDKSVIKPMLNFSGLDLYGNMCVTINNQSITFLINMFFGVIYNAAVSIAMAVNGTILGLTTTISQAFRPQIIKLYAVGDIENMQKAMENSVRFTLIAIAVLSVPCAFNASYILQLWLGQTPLHAVEFLRWIIWMSFFVVINSICNTAVHSTGNIKRLSFISGSFFLLVPVCIWAAFSLGCSAPTAFLVKGIIFILIIANTCTIICKLIPRFRLWRFVIVIAKTFIILIGAIIPLWIIQLNMESSFARLLMTYLTYALLVGVSSWFFVLTPQNRAMICNYIIVKYHQLLQKAEKQ